MQDMTDRLARAISRFVVLGGMGLMLVGCNSIRDAAGITKDPPDEFAVVTKAPLVIPPDFNLRPPKPGAAPTNQVSPTASAEEALYSDDPATIAAGITGDYSEEEKILLAKSGGVVADHGIRQQIAADAKNMEAADDSFTDMVLFREPEPDNGKALDADSEADRIGDAKAQGKPITPSSGTATPPQGQSDDAKSSDGTQIQKDSGGWLDGIFGGIF
jgi:hypothetical protein